MEIAVLIPTLRRPAGLRRVLVSLENTAPQVHKIIAADSDDERAGMIAERHHAVISICERNRAGCAYAWNTALKAAPNHDAYVIASDDCEFLPGWLESALLKLDEIGESGLVGLRCSMHRAKKLSIFYLMTRDFIIEHHGGVAAIPHYTAWFVDAEACDRAQKAGCYTKTDNVVMTHDRMTDDEAALLTISRIDENRILYMKRRGAGFPDDFPPILRKQEQ